MPILGECHHQDNTLTQLYHHGPPQDLLTHILSWTYTPNAINLHTLTYQPTYITGPVFWPRRDSTLQLGRLREKLFVLQHELVPMAESEDF